MKKYYELKLINAKIVEINRICNLIRIVFLSTNDELVHLHITCFIRMYDSNGELFLSSTNTLIKSPNHKKKWYKKYDWTVVGATRFDDELEEYKQQLMSATVKKLEFINNDIIIILSNNIQIDIKTNITKSMYDDYSENYRIFIKNKAENDFNV